MAPVKRSYYLPAWANFANDFTKLFKWNISDLKPQFNYLKKCKIMKTKWLIFTIAVTLILNSCNGQENKKESISDTKKHEPKENIKVNKEYDEQGNLIRYDSTYTYFYSNIEGNQIAEDSIYDNFQKMFGTNYPFSSKSYFDDLFFEDSLLKYDFYKKDFFSERFKQNMQHMDKLFWEMDSIKNQFFDEQFPEENK